MIEPQRVVEEESELQTLDPPRVPRLAKPVPTVKRIPPQLAGVGEVVGWNTGELRGRPVVVQMEKLLVRPHVGRVDPDHERQIAHQLDARRAGVAPRLAPLPIQLPLQPRLAQQIVRVLAPQGGQRRQQPLYEIAVVIARIRSLPPLVRRALLLAGHRVVPTFL